MESIIEQMTDTSKTNPGDLRQSTRGVRVMFADSYCLGIFADEIESIADWRIPAPLPNSPAGVLGVVCLRGRMLTVLGASTLVGGKATENRKIVALRGDEQIALAVEQVDEIIDVAPDDLQTPNARDSVILGVIADGGRSIRVLDPKQLFAMAMRGRERRRRHF